MRIEMAEDPVELARRAAADLAATLRDAVAARGRATLAVSGGHTPGDVLSVLAGHELPWSHVHLFQVDERVAPEGHPDRNLELVRHRFLASRQLPPAHVHTMPVGDTDLDAAADRYAAELAAVAGDPPVVDVVQLGLGADGHTASLVPGDPVVEVADRQVAPTGAYRGRRRLTLTRPALARARQLVWVVRGADKAEAVAGLVAGEPWVLGALLPQEHAVLFVDRAAAAGLAASRTAGDAGEVSS